MVTSGDISQFVTYSNNTITVSKDFDIEYIFCGNGFMLSHTTIKAGVYTRGGTGARIFLGFMNYGTTECWVGVQTNNIKIMITVFDEDENVNISYEEGVTMTTGNWYKLYA